MAQYSMMYFFKLLLFTNNSLFEISQDRSSNLFVDLFKIFIYWFINSSFIPRNQKTNSGYKDILCRVNNIIFSLMSVGCRPKCTDRVIQK